MSEPVLIISRESAEILAKVFAMPCLAECGNSDLLNGGRETHVVTDRFWPPPSGAYRFKCACGYSLRQVSQFEWEPDGRWRDLEHNVGGYRIQINNLEAAALKESRG